MSQDQPEQENKGDEIKLNISGKKIKEVMDKADIDNRPKLIIYFDRFLWLFLVIILVWRFLLVPVIMPCDCKAQFEAVAENVGLCAEDQYGNLHKVETTTYQDEGKDMMQVDLGDIKTAMGDDGGG